jgi:Thermopsin
MNGLLGSGSKVGNRVLIAIVVASVMVIGGMNIASALGAHTGPAQLRGTSATPSAIAPVGSPSHAGLSKVGGPTVGGPAANLAAALSKLPASTQKAAWIQALLHPGASLKPLVSLPNLNLLEHPATSVAGSVAPGYVAQPAPLGLGDFGLGATPYAVNTTHILGQVTFNSPPNETDPGSTGVIEPSTNGPHLGYVGSTNEFGIQLNTVVQNITFPGSDQGFFWTQNVVNWNDTAIHFVSDTFNVSAGSGFYIAPGTIYSGCSNNSVGAQNILDIYGGVFQCVAGSVPLTAASYPVTIQLFNNVSVSDQGRDVVNYSYFIHENGTGHIYTGTYNSVVFNNPAAPATPAVKPEFTINGFHLAPMGLLRDAEIVLVGDIGGDNTVFRALNATVHLEYSNLSVGGWGNAPSGYNFGGDTGETSTGIADYWTAGHTLVMHQGPAMLYGLWNAQPSVSVGPGAIHLAGTIIPSYGFVFVSNTPPVSDYLIPTAPPDNFSWLPTAEDGSFNTYLPPLGGAWTTQYFVQAYADGSQELNGTPITGTDVAYNIVLVPHGGDLQTPLYMFGNAQAKDLAVNVTGSLVPPYVFNNLFPQVNLSFNHLNDYGYPSFEVFMAQGVTVPITVSAVGQGPDAPGGAFYLSDGASGPGGLLYPKPAVLGPLDLYTSQINIYFGVGASVHSEDLLGVDGQGGEIVLWMDDSTFVSGIDSVGGSQGVFVGDCVNTIVQDVTVSFSIGVQDVGSTATQALDIQDFGGVAVESYSSTGGIYATIGVTGGGLGVEAGADFGLGSGFLASYYDLLGARAVLVTDLNLLGGYVGVNLTLSTLATVTNLHVTGSYGAVQLDTDTGSSVSFITCIADVFCFMTYTDPAQINHVLAVNNEVGGVLVNSTGTHVTQSVFFGSTYEGLEVLGGMNNVVAGNSFIHNGGSTLVYNPLTPQAYSTPGNFFNSSAGPGNYWSDWQHGFHGVLPPYPVGAGVVDQHPLSAGTVGTEVLTFTETGLPAKVLAKNGWTVSVDGLTNHSKTASIPFTVVNGTFPDLVMGPSGYVVSGPAGVVPGPDVTVYGATNIPVEIAKGKTLTLTFAQKGIPPTGYLAVDVNGVEQSTTGKSVKFGNLTAGTYNYTVVAPTANATLSLKKTPEPLSGTLTLTKSEKLTLTYLYTYAVVFTESGFSGSWSVKIKHTTETNATGGNITFFLGNGNYRYSIGKETGYVSVGSPPHIFTVNGSAVVVTVTFTLRP